MTATMKAVEYDRYGSPEVLKVRDVAVPRIKADEILVCVHAAGVNPKDVFVRKGRFKLLTGSRFPKRIGYDFAGEIIKVGKTVVKYQAGEQVYGMINGWHGGAYAGFVAVKVKEVALMPGKLGFDEAAAVPLAGQTAMQALRDLGGIKNGDRVCINGSSGGVGIFALQVAKDFGAIVTSICSTRNVRLCEENGADEVVDYTKTAIESTQKRFDIFFDVFGNKSFAKSKHLLTPQGVYITTVPNLINISSRLATIISPGKKARLVWVNSNDKDLALLSEWMEEQRIRPLIDRAYRLEDTIDAHEYIQSKRAKGKVILRIHQGD